MMRKRLVILAAAALLVAGMAQAQTANPTAVVFDHVDFASATSYSGGYFLMPTIAGVCDLAGTPAAAPVMTDNLGKPTTTTGVAMTAPLGAKPIGCYVYRVRVMDSSGLYSAWSPASNIGQRLPLAPSVPAIK